GSVGAVGPVGRGGGWMWGAGRPDSRRGGRGGGQRARGQGWGGGGGGGGRGGRGAPAAGGIRATMPRQPACTQASTPATGSCRTIGTQSAVKMASTTSGEGVTRGSVSGAGPPGATA